MRNRKSVDKIMVDTKDKYTANFISELLFKFSNLSGTQVNSIKNILQYNNLTTIDELVNHINACFNYEGSKSSGEYKKFLYGDGYDQWLKEFNSSRAKSKIENQNDPKYVKNMYCETICKEIDYKHDVETVYELVKDYIPLNETIRDIIIRVLKLSRFDNVKDYKSNIKWLYEYKGSRSNNNREYGVVLLGEAGYDEYMNNSVSLSKKSKRDNFIAGIDSDERYIKFAKTLIKTYDVCGYTEEFVANIMKSTQSFDIENDMHKRWLADQLKFQDFDTVDQRCDNMNKIINFTGNRKHSIEWDTLRFGVDEAENRRLIHSYVFKGLNNPHTIKARFNSTKTEKLTYIKNLFQKDSEYYIDPISISHNQTFYIVHIENDVYKVGITRDFNKRFNHNRYNKALVVYETSVYEALVLEIIFKILYGTENTDEHDGFGYTETFNGLTDEIMLDRFQKIKKIIEKEMKKEAT